MRTTLARTVAAAVMLTSLVVAGGAQPAAAAVRTVGNGIFRVHMQDAPGQGAGVGTFTITTGPDHPAGEGQNVLFGDGFPGTSILSMVDNIDTLYTNADGVQSVASGFNPNFTVFNPGVVQLGDHVAHIGQDSFAIQVIYDPPGQGCEPFFIPACPGFVDFRIIQNIQVMGTSLADTTVLIETTVQDQRTDAQGDSSADVYQLFDYRVGDDDGPTLQPLSPDGAVLTDETAFSEPAFRSFRVQNNDGNAPLAFETVIHDPIRFPFSQPPSGLDFVCWPEAYPDITTYEPVPDRDISSAGSPCDPDSGDSAVLLRQETGNLGNYDSIVRPTTATFRSVIKSIEPGTITPPPTPVNRCASADRTLVGTEGDDVLVGTPGDDVIAGLGGNDVISGGGGNDNICGGRGEDTIDGGVGNDRLFGGGGRDTLVGDAGDDIAYGGGGDDDIDGGAGNDILRGNGGADSLRGAAGNDLLSGGAGDDRLLGGIGDDTLLGGEDDDKLNGGDGADACDGEAGVNSVIECESAPARLSQPGPTPDGARQLKEEIDGRSRST